MRLKNCKNNEKYKVVCLHDMEDKLKLRLYEIGFFPNSNITVLNKSYLKHTLLVQVLDSCFAIKDKIANLIEVDYE